MTTTVDITLDQALAVIQAARQKAEAQGTLMDIAVVDAGANLKAFVRMDDAFLGSIDISIKKAKTARFFNMPTGELGKLAQPGASLYHIEFSNEGLITFAGGCLSKTSRGSSSAGSESVVVVLRTTMTLLQPERKHC